jgi:hypothetical protein
VTEERVVVHSAVWKLVFAGLRGFGAVVCVLAATSGAGGTAGRVGFALLAAGTALAAVRGLSTGAYAGRDDVLIRNTFRTHRVSWHEIEEVAPPPRRRRFVVTVTLRGGKRVGVDGCWSPSQRRLNEMASLIRSLRPDSDAMS